MIFLPVATEAAPILSRLIQQLARPESVGRDDIVSLTGTGFVTRLTGGGASAQSAVFSSTGHASYTLTANTNNTSFAVRAYSPGSVF